MSKAVVFAGRSFVGRHLCAALCQSGVDVVATARKEDKKDIGDIGEGKGDIPLFLCDLTVSGQVAELIERERPDWVIQCAGATHCSDPSEMNKLHVDGTRNVLSAVVRFAPHAIVLLLGSAAEYGPVPPEQLPVQEQQVCKPATPFGASKLAQTQLAKAAAEEWGLRVLTVRPFNILGPGLPEHYFAGALARRLRQLRSEGGPCEFPVANLHATRDWVDVRDVASALMALLYQASPEAGRMEIYNLATGIETPLRSVAHRLGQLAGGFVPIDAGVEVARAGIERSCGDARRLRRATGWEPRFTWEQSIDDMWRVFTSSTLQ